MIVRQRHHGTYFPSVIRGCSKDAIGKSLVLVKGYCDPDQDSSLQDLPSSTNRVDAHGCIKARTRRNVFPSSSHFYYSIYFRILVVLLYLSLTTSSLRLVALCLAFRCTYVPFKHKISKRTNNPIRINHGLLQSSPWLPRCSLRIGSSPPFPGCPGRCCPI